MLKLQNKAILDLCRYTVACKWLYIHVVSVCFPALRWHECSTVAIL